MREIRLFGDPILRANGTDVPRETIPSYTALVNEMFDIMYKAEGIGLAAQQIGLTDRITVIDTRDSGQKVFINPVIIKHSDEMSVMEEGCLSFPNIRADITRPKRIELEYYDLTGTKIHCTLDDLLARVVQHEIDHLNGILFIDHMSPVKRMLLKKKLEKIKERQRKTS
ncbi:peptide deformylase [bacterium]|nr:peptide deformylase [bacterium]